MAVVDIYARVSTDPQEENTSLDEQENLSRQFCKDNGLVVGMVHREVFSGYQYREREKLDLMRQRYREGNIQGVVIRTLDRLSRSQVHNAILMEEMEHHGVTLYCIKENIDDTPMGKFIRMVLAFVAEMEREKIMDRTTTGRVSKAREGKIVSGSKPLYGYDWQYDGAGNKTVVLNEDQAEIVRELAEQYAVGVSAYSLKLDLNARGVPSPNGSEWNDRSIVRILSDERITGKNAQIFAHQQRKTKQPLEPIDLPDGTYPAIISDELFEQIKQRREMNKADAIRSSREPEEYLLRAGFVKCGRCGFPMLAAKNRQHYTYRCTHNLRSDIEHTNVIRSKPLDEEVWAWTQQLADHITLIEKAVELAASSNKIQKDTEAIEHSIEAWQAKAKNYLADLDDGTLVGDTRTAIRNALNNATKMVLLLEDERAQLLAGMIDKERERTAYREILAWCRKVKESREELTYQRKRDFLHMLGIVVIVENEMPYYENLVYRVEITLPVIQELIVPGSGATCGTSSPEDIDVTKQLVEAAQILDIELLDHLVIGNPRYVSLKERMGW